jgi:uncharacterized protein YfaS (alpha-2-macroglobulin family)
VFIPVNPYDHYVGLQKPRFTWGYGQVGQSLGINTIVTDSTGRPASGRQLTYRIYHNSRYWWWEYDTRDDFRIRYKKDTFTKLVKEGSLMSRNVPSRIEFTPEGSGEFLIEVREGQKDGHAAGFFFSAYYWGDSPVTDVGAGTLVLKSDKKIYHPGDTATITFPTPENGTIFVSVEKGHRILESKAVRAKTENKEYQTVIPITAEMLPNAYVSVSIIQPHGQTLNDRPLRMYGVIPLHVEDPRTRQRLEISMPNELRSEEEFEVTVTSVDKRSTQFTIAVVDEGLLDITRFKTPNPWSHFFKKQRLGVLTFDLFGLVIGAHKGDIFRLFSVGGEVEGAGYRDSQLEPAGKKRFPAVSMFQGPLETDESGRSRVKFKLPNYIGSVRVMVVSASGRSYGSVDKTVPVKTELMVLPTLPRALGPTDIFSLPVTVFAMKEKIKNVEVKVEASGPVEIMGAERKSIKFDSPGERDAIFELKALPAVGEAKVTVTASSGRFRSSKISEIVVRPYSPRLFSVEKKECLPGDSVKLKIPDRGIPGTNQAVISVMRRDQLNLGHRLKWLIHYPYGCIEQTVSAVFPQLYLKEFIKRSADHESEIDRNINAAIEKLRRFSTASGGFGFWPGGSQVSIWGTNYAGHFLCEAKKLGYRIPDGLLSSWIRFQKSRSLTTRDSLLVKVYRLYTLALAGEAQIGPMNLIKETSLKEMTNTEKWMLAASYFLAGHPDVAKNIFRGARTDVSEYKEVGGTYGSWLRDKAMILEATTLFEEWNLADKIFEEVVLEISGKSWYSTQSLGYALLALGKYIQANQSDFRDVKPLMSGYIKIPGKKRIPFKTERLKVSQEITAGFGENVQVVIDKETNLKRVFVALEWNGVPLRPDVKDSSSNLILEVEWLNENGMQIEPSSIKQGTTFWGHFRARSNTYRRRGLEELALVQLMPSGWEIENIRLQGEELPEWMRKWALNREEYQDIRDDRVMWFFDLPWNQKHLDFVVKLTAVTVGEFILPPTLFEAMYDNNYKAIKSGMSVKVTER